MVFPTDVGMNRSYCEMGNSYRRVPHRRGDEPGEQKFRVMSVKCSPSVSVGGAGSDMDTDN